MAKPFKITFCGDTSLGYYYLEKGKNKYPEAYERLQNDPFSFFEGVAPLLEGSDEVIVNLETVLTKNPGQPIEGKEYPGCDDPDVTIEVLKKLGVTAVTLANNHTMDFGEKNLLEMIDLLRDNGIATIGAGRNRDKAREPYVITSPNGGKRIYIINGMRARKRYIEYGFFAEKDKPGIASTNLRATKQQIEKIKREDPECKVIVMPHWQGIDYKDVGEKQSMWCEEILAAGADAVIGHGSHKKDSVLELSGRPAYLSIGNFVFNAPGRYAAKGAEPLSSVVTFSCMGKEEEWQEKEILTDNRVTNFNVVEFQRSASEDRSPCTSTGHLDIEFLSSLEGYKSSVGFSQVRPGGIEYVLSDINKGEVLLVVDNESWAKVRRERSKQVGLSDKEIVENAVKRGAVGFISARDFDSQGYPLIIVEDSRDYFLEAAKKNRSRYSGKMISVTGTAGKSSTVAMLKSVLSELGEKVLAPSGNTNTLYGVASLLTRLNTSHTCCVVEAALSGYARFEEHVGKYILPDISVITSLDVSQPEITSSAEGTAFFKCRQIESLQQKGVSIFCSDTPVRKYIDAVSEIFASKKVSYGEENGDYLILGLKIDGSGRSLVRYLEPGGEEREFFVNTPSVAMAKNALAVLSVCKEFGYSVPRVHELIGQAKKIKRVLDFSVFNLPGKKITIIDDTKNATISSLKESLSVVSSLDSSRTIAVIGDLVHLGEHKADIYKMVNECLASSEVDFFVGFGKDIDTALKDLDERYLGRFDREDDLSRFLVSFVKDGDVLLVKGSSRNTKIRLAADSLKINLLSKGVEK